MNDKVSRRSFVVGIGVAAVVPEVAASVAGAPATAAENTSPARRLPPGFTYADGVPPAVEPIKVTRGTVSSIGHGNMTVATADGGEQFNPNNIRFVWADGLVSRLRAHTAVKTGDSVVIIGTAKSSGEYNDVQQLWVNPEVDLLPSRAGRGPGW